MTVVLACLSAGMPALAWRGFLRPSGLPVHMMPGEWGLDAFLLRASRWGLALARVSAAPLVVLSCGDTQRALAASTGLALLLAVVVVLRVRSLRSAAAPLLEDGVWLLGTAAVGSAVLGVALNALVVGALIGAGALVAAIALQVFAWGRSSGFWISARPDFQVFAPNPDNRYAMGRIHIGAQPVVVRVPDNGSPYPAIGIYDMRFRRVHLARWQQVRALFDAHGELRVHVGLHEDAEAGHLSFAVPPGRYYFTVRNYLCERPEAPRLPERVR